MKVLAWPAFKTRYKNPYNWLLYSSMVELGVQVEEFSPRRLLVSRYDVVHLHWPAETIVRHPVRLIASLRVLVFVGLLRWCRWRGAVIFWTIHDRQPHVLLHADLARRCETQLGKLVDATIRLCRIRSAVELPSILAAKPSFVIPHGHYRDAYPNQISRFEARRYLGVPPQSRVLLYFGYISPYKNVPQLIQTVTHIVDDNLVLLVAGKPDNGTIQKELQATTDPRVHLHLKYIPDAEVQLFYQAADLVVLPFRSILNSGSTLLALSFKRPVLVPAMGALPEWQAHCGQHWVRTYEGGLNAEILLSAMQQPDLPGERDRLDLGKWDWSLLAQHTLEAYQAVGGPG